MRRSISKASGDGSDRPTTPGVGEDSRATLPEPQPPALASPELNRTIPMGSALTSEWLASQVAAKQTSSIPPANAPAQPATKSDWVPRAPHQQTLHSFGSAPPPRIETDDKRWIGSPVEPSLNTTQRAFSAVPPAPHRDAGGQTLHAVIPKAPAVASLGSTVRVMGAPPPVGGSAPPSDPAPPPIKPAPMITISPEIAIPSTRSSNPPRAAASTTAPTSDRPVASPISDRPARPSSTPPELKPRTGTQSRKSPPHAQTAMRPEQHDVQPPRVAGGLRARTLAIGFGVAVAAIGIILFFTTPRSAAPAVTHQVTPATTASSDTDNVDLRPSTQIVTNPPGAEIILRGALVANSPARVVRPAYESLYLVRLRGHQPQLVSLSQHSPDTIHLDLQPLAGAAPADSIANTLTVQDGTP